MLSIVHLLLFSLPSLALATESVDGVSTSTAKQKVVVMQESWLWNLLLNLSGYATVLLPGYLIIRYVRSSKYLERAGPGCVGSTTRLCIAGADHEKPVDAAVGAQNEPAQVTFAWQAAKLIFCFIGLQLSYLTWGILQERIMTRKYGKSSDSEGESFGNSQFLVFMNRILALFVAMIVIVSTQQPRHTAPLYKYSFCSFSNIMSAWCQYEALKFISFPTQVLAKACKIIPVMLMGKIVSQRTYSWQEYLEAGMISVGVSMFLLTSQDASRHHTTSTSLSGFIILVGYMLFDSFTSNWQGEIFRTYKVSSFQMMAGVNVFSCLLTMTTLLQQGGFFSSAAFILRYPDFMLHVIVLSVCSATGQLFIYYTISQFGPVVFTIIMTIRQALAILLSCLIYAHPITIVGFCGVLVVFSAVFMKIYFNFRRRQLEAQRAAAAKPAKSASEA